MVASDRTASVHRKPLFECVMRRDCEKLWWSIAVLSGVEISFMLHGLLHPRHVSNNAFHGEDGPSPVFTVVASTMSGLGVCFSAS